MNKAYRLIWNHAKGTWTVVAEIVKSRGRSATMAISAAAVLAAICCGAAPAFAIDPSSLPTGGQIIAGQADITQSGSAMTVIQGSQRLIANWDTFNIGQNASVDFSQPNSSAIALNRIQDQNPSQILGSLSANGQVWLLNSAGIIFGSSAQVDVGGLVASSLNISNEDFLSGNTTFEKTGGAGTIVNQGTIRTVSGGYVAFLSPKISNTGTITAPNGTVALTAGDKVSLDFTGDQLITFTVDQGAIDAVAENKGLIKVDGGLVVLTAKAADELTASVVNNEGVIEAHTLESKEGRILLISDMEHGETVVGGRLDASAPNGGDGGFIETSAAKVTVRDDVQISTAASSGKTGLWLIDPVDITIGTDVTGAAIATALQATNVTLDTSGAGSCTGVACGALGGTNGDITVNDNITVTGGSSDTTLTLKANRNIVMNSGTSIDASGNGTNKVNVVFCADSDATDGGYIHLKNGSTIKSNGGTISLVGGIDGTGYAEGTSTQTASPPHQDGISISSSTLDSRVYSGGAPQSSGGGTITLKGKGYAGNLTLHGGGLWAGFGSIYTGGGGLVMDVQAQENAGATEGGIRYGAFLDGMTINTDGGNVQISTAVPSSTSWMSFYSNGSITTSGNLVINSTGSINGIGSFAVGGSTTLTAGSSNNITLTNASNNFTGAVSVVSGNDVSIKDTNSLTLGAVTADGNITAEALGGDLTISGNISKTAGADATATYKASNSIVVNNGVSITSTNNKLNTILWADSDATNGGYISLLNTSGITTNGGHLWLGGGSGSTTWNGLAVGNGYASGNATDSNGIFLEGTTISTGGGNIALYGRSFNGAAAGGDGSATNNGIHLSKDHPVSINSGTGTIYLKGLAEAVAGTIEIGIQLNYTGPAGGTTHSITSAAAGGADAITLWGEGGSGTGNSNGLQFQGANLSATGGGNIFLHGTEGTPGSNWGGLQLNNFEWNLDYINAGSGNLVIEADTISNLAGLSGTGQLIIRPITAGKAISIGTAGSAAGPLSLPSTYFATNFTNGFSNIIIGSATAGAITVDGNVTYNDPLTIKTGNSIFFSTTSAVTGNNNALTLWTRAGGNDTADDDIKGSVWMPIGSSVNTGGGNITIGGGSDPTIGYALGDTNATSGENNARYRGVTVNGTLDADGGNIAILGRGNGVPSDPNARGVSIGGSISTTGSGTIDIKGMAKGTSDGLALGDSALGGLSLGTISAVDGDITLQGIKDTGSNGINLSTVGSGITTSGTGSLSMTSTGNIGGTNGVLAIAGATGLTAGASSITLNNASNNFTGAVSVVSGGAVALKDANGLSLDAAEVSGDLTVEALGGNLTIAGDISKNSGGDATAIFKASGSVIQNAGAGIGSSSNQLHTLYWADSDATDGGYVSLQNSSSVATNGGNLWIGGGSGSTTWNGLTIGDGYAIGDATNSNGVSLSGTSVVTGGGNLAIFGQSRTGEAAGNTWSHGVVLDSSTGTNSLNTGAGDLEITGIGKGTSGNSNGVEIGRGGFGTTSLQTSSGNIAITGTGTDSGNLSAMGINIVGSSTQVLATGSGNVALTGVGGTTSGASNSSGVGIFSGAVLSESGDITLNGTMGSGSAANVQQGIYLSSGRIGEAAGTAVENSSSDITLTADSIYSTSYTTLATMPSNMTTYRDNVGETYAMSVTGSTIGSTVWGTGPFTDDSYIPKAAVFSGSVADGATSTLYLQMMGSQTSYDAGTANGVTTSSYGPWPGSYDFVAMPQSTIIASTGSLVMQSPGAAFSKAFSTNGLSLGSGLTGLTIGSSTNTAGVSIDALDIGIDGPVGITGGSVAINRDLSSSSTIDVAALTGDLSLSGAISTSDTSSNAIVLNAGKNAAAGTSTGGNIIVSSGSVSTGEEGRTTLYTGSVSGSTGLTALIGSGSGNFRYNSAEESQGYSTALTSGTYAIYREQPTLTIDADDKTATYGTSPTLTTSLSGLQNGDTSGQAISTAATVSVGGDTSTSDNYIAGDHTLTPSGAAGGLGYGFSYTTGTLTVNQLALTISGISAANKVYDGNNTATTDVTGAVYSGLVTDDDLAVAATGTFSDKNVATGKTVTLTSSYSGADVNNYSITDQASTTADILPKVLTISANNDVKIYDGLPYNGGNGVLYSGFISGEGIAELIGTLVYGGSSQGAVIAGDYPISPSGLTAQNYTISNIDGVLSISGSSLPSDAVVSSLVSQQNAVNGTQQNNQESQTTPLLGPGSGSDLLSQLATNQFVSTPLNLGATILTTPIGSTQLSFTSQSGGGLSLYSGQNPATEQMIISGHLAVFGQVGTSTPVQQETITVQEGSQSISVHPAAEGLEPTVAPATSMAMAAPEQLSYWLTQPTGQVLSFGVSVTSDGFLVITLPTNSLTIDRQQVTLMGLLVAKQELKQDLKELNGIIFRN